MSATTTTIVGSAECPTGFLLNHDGDERRANLCSDGRVLCVVCGTIAHDLTRALKMEAVGLPMPVRELIAHLTSSSDPKAPTFKLNRIHDGSTESIDSDRALAALAQDIDCSVFAVVRIGLGVPPYGFDTIEISYPKGDAEAATAAPKPAVVDLSGLSDAHPPASVMKAAGELVINGFHLVHVAGAGESMRTATFRKGDQATTSHGVTARISWIAI